MTHKEYLFHRSRSPETVFPQYSRKLPVRREKNAATPEILWLPAGLPSSIQGAAPLGCTTPVPRYYCIALKSPHSASSRGYCQLHDLRGCFVGCVKRPHTAQVAWRKAFGRRIDSSQVFGRHNSCTFFRSTADQPTNFTV